MKRDDSEQNSEDAPRRSAGTRCGAQRERVVDSGQILRSLHAGAFRHAKNIKRAVEDVRMLHAGAFGDKNTERVVDSGQKSEDSQHGSAILKTGSGSHQPYHVL